MLVIRYRRIGKRNFAQYKIVVAEKSFSVKGRFLEALGSYNPHNKEVILKEDRIKHWIGVGAQCSDSVHNLLVFKGVIKGVKRKSGVNKKFEEASVEETKPEEKKEAETVVETKEVSAVEPEKEKTTKKAKSEEEIKEKIELTEKAKPAGKIEDKKEQPEKK